MMGLLRECAYTESSRSQSAHPMRNPQLKGRDPDDLILLALMSAHRSGYVRAEVIHSLGRDSSGTTIPFLLLRLVDWVEAVRRAADLELIDKLQPQYGDMFVRCLGLLER